MTEKAARKLRRRKAQTSLGLDAAPEHEPGPEAREKKSGQAETGDPSPADSDLEAQEVTATADPRDNAIGPSAPGATAHLEDAIKAGDPLAQRLGEAIGEQAIRRALDEHLAQVQPPPTPAPLPRRSFINDMPDRGLFVTVTVLVAAIILVAKIYGAPAAPIAIFTVGSMLGYGLLAYRLPAVRMRLDRLGDNFYYMGFVFTLASMAAALLQLNAGMDVEALLGSFGIALLTTMAGIAGRVTFVQMRSEVDDVEEHIRRDLLEAGDQLRSQLSAAVRDLEAFRLGTQQMLQERMEQTLEKYTEAAVGQVTRLGNTAQEIMDRVDTAFGANHAHAQELNRIAQKTVEAADHLLARIAAINPPPDVLERKLENLTEKLNTSAEAFAKASAVDQERQKALAEVGLKLEALLGRLGQQLENVDVGLGSMSAAGAKAESLAAALDSLNAQLAALNAAVAKQEKEFSNGAEGVARVREQLDADLSASRRAVLDVQRALADTARIVKAELQGVPVD